jgi:hypothetical protein
MGVRAGRHTFHAHRLCNAFERCSSTTSCTGRDVGAVPLPELRTMAMLGHRAVARPARWRGGEHPSTSSAAKRRRWPHVVP